MFQRDTLYLLVNSIAPVLAIAAIFGFIAGNFVLAWACAFCVVLCMESRAQLGQRVPHTTVFLVHLLSAIPFFLALTAITFLIRSVPLTVLTGVLGLIALCTGAILWYRGMEARMLHLA